MRIKTSNIACNEPLSHAKNQISLIYFAGQNHKEHSKVGVNKSAERHSPWAACSISVAGTYTEVLNSTPVNVNYLFVPINYACVHNLIALMKAIIYMHNNKSFQSNLGRGQPRCETRGGTLWNKSAHIAKAKARRRPVIKMDVIASVAA